MADTTRRRFTGRTGLVTGGGAGLGFARAGILAVAGQDGVAAGTGPGDQAGAAAGPAQVTPDGAVPGQAGGVNGNNPAAGPAGKGCGGPIVIGTLRGFSAVNSAASPASRAMQAWAASVDSRGGLGGRQVKLIPMDDGYDPGKSKSQMQQLVEQYNAVAVFGAQTVPETLNTWKGYVESKGVPMIGGSCGYEWAQPSPVLFNQCMKPTTGVFGMA